MKILQLIYSLSSGGAERFVVDLSNRLAQNNDDEVVLVTILDESNPQWTYYLGDLSSKVRFVNLNCRRGLSLKSIFRIFKVIMHEKADVVHIHCNLIFLYLPTLLLRRSKYVHTLHSLAVYCLGWRGFRGMNCWLYKTRVQPVTISNECDKSFRELYALDTSICIINGREPVKIDDSFKMEVTLNRTCPVFIHVARCSPEKNQPRLFRIFERLLSDGLGYELLCLGSNYGEYAEKYKNHPQIHVLGEKKNVGDYMRQADYFILSSDYEGLPLTLLEAMSLGLTPISTPAGGVVDVIRDGENGYIAQSFDDEDFYRKVRDIIVNRKIISPELIRHEFESLYSMELCAEKYHSLYQRIHSDE